MQLRPRRCDIEHSSADAEGLNNSRCCTAPVLAIVAGTNALRYHRRYVRVNGAGRTDRIKIAAHHTKDMRTRRIKTSLPTCPRWNLEKS